LIASAATEAALIPVAATVLSRVTFAGLVLNLAAIPLMALAQIAGMIVIPLFAVSERLAAISGWLAHVGAEGLVRSAGLLEFAPALTWRVAAPSGVSTTLYYIALASVWTMCRPRPVSSGSARSSVRYFRALSAAAFGTAAIWILLEPAALLRSRGDGRLHVTFLDVGQGDAALVQFPQGDTLLVDTGGVGGSGAFDIGDRVVAPLLRGAGVRRLGTLALTHGDVDHIGGARSLIREFRPWELWEGIPVPQSEPLRNLQVLAHAVGSRWANVQASDHVRIGGVDVFVRHPGRPDWERQRTRNNDSIVLEVVWQDVSVVLTGDIGRETELSIASHFAASPLRVIKVPHHGSRTSSSPEFLRALAPRLAVFSVGRANQFGHPAPAVLDGYALVGADIFRTDRDGAVEIESNGQSLDVRGFTGRHLHLTPRSSNGRAGQR
jgi:competence protein ComEC